MKREKKVSFRFFIAFYLGKFGQILTKLIMKDKGTNYPGRFAIKICPDFLSRMARPDTVIAVTGTNGKTSTSNFINEIFIKNGISTINNSKGSNLASGIASSLIEAADMLGRVKEKVAIFEVDERASAFIYDHIKPTFLLCTNLFRDSIKRNGHSEFILTKIKSSVPESTTLILNADDLISSSIGRDTNRKVFFAVDKLDIDKDFNNIVKDIVACPDCKSKLKFKYRHYHHIGSSYCSECGFKSPEPDFLATNVDLNKREFILKEGKKELKYKLISDSVFNVYNTVSAIAVARLYGLTHNQIKKVVENLSIKKDRYDVDIINNVEVTTMLSKDQNPISCSLMFDHVISQPGNKVVVLCITDSKDVVHGSEDISWLYDTDFEYLNNENVKQIIACGTRSHDVALRLKIAGINPKTIYLSSDYKNVEDMIICENIDKIFILYELYAYPFASNLKKKIIAKIGESK